LNQLEDNALIALIVQENEAALGELYDRYGRLLFSVAYRVTGDRGSAEEVALDVFTRVWRNAHRYRADKAKVSTWITRMARHRAIDLLRQEEIRPLKHSISWAEASPEPGSGKGGPEDATHLSLQQQRVRSAVNSLSEEQQQVLGLAFFKGYTHQEISRLLELPLGTVKGRIRAGMQKLRLLLQDERP
jgi:RNA polymerase sigma-70 factor (ECF subfamily)